MIQNARQYQIAQAKLRDLLLDLAALDLPDADLHPQQILVWQNSLKILIGKLQQEIAEYEPNYEHQPK
jgi:hypothetical protein